MATEQAPRGFWGSVPGILTAIAAVVTAVAGLFAVMDKHDAGTAPVRPPGAALAPSPTPAFTPPAPVFEMGPLREGLNLDGYDLKPEHWNVASAGQCADMCLSDASCKAMTYVRSNRSCWLKSRVPTPVDDPKRDMVSAIKQERH